jgi:hypothetical protein
LSRCTNVQGRANPVVEGTPRAPAGGYFGAMWTLGGS